MAAKQRRLPRSKWLTCLLLGPVLGGLVATCLVSKVQTWKQLGDLVQLLQRGASCMAALNELSTRATTLFLHPGHAMQIMLQVLSSCPSDLDVLLYTSAATTGTPRAAALPAAARHTANPPSFSFQMLRWASKQTGVQSEPHPVAK